MQWRVVTHHRPHLDEIVAIWILINFGSKEFPGIENLDLATDIIYLDNGGNDTPDGRTPEEREADGVLMLGVCGSRFDEHARGGRDAKEGECAATLVAKTLGVDKDPTLRQILDYALRADTGGDPKMFGLASMISIMHNDPDTTPKEVLNWGIRAIRAIHTSQRRFVRAREIVKQRAKTYDTHGVHVVVVEADNDRVPAATRSLQKRPCVIVHRQSDGHTQIYTQRGIQLDFGILAGLLRNAEIEAGTDTPNDIDNLKQAGGPIASWFFLDCENPMLLNGTPQHPGVPPSRLDLEDIVACIKEARLHTLAAAVTER